MKSRVGVVSLSHKCSSSSHIKEHHRRTLLKSARVDCYIPHNLVLCSLALCWSRLVCIFAPTVHSERLSHIKTSSAQSLCNNLLGSIDRFYENEKYQTKREEPFHENNFCNKTLVQWVIRKFKCTSYQTVFRLCVFSRLLVPGPFASGCWWWCCWPACIALPQPRPMYNAFHPYSQTSLGIKRFFCRCGMLLAAWLGVG